MRIADCGLIADLPIHNPQSAFRNMMAAMSERLSRQIAFLVEADKLKTIDRRTPLTDGSRAENSAEHSWHLGLAALTLSEYAGHVDVARVLELLAIHDLVEIDAGDTFAYDVAANDTKAERERAAAIRIFGLLPADQAARLHAAWTEFEAFETRESRFANALDRLQALLQNMQAGGGSWTDHRITRSQVLRRMAPVEAALPDVWPFVVGVIDSFCQTGAIAND
jgi:putative hydrolases of HD superfamily